MVKTHNDRDFLQLIFAFAILHQTIGSPPIRVIFYLCIGRGRYLSHLRQIHKSALKGKASF